MIKNKLLYFLTERAFNRALSTPGIEDTSIAFVGDEDNKFIYTHGTKFNSGGASTSDIESVVEQYIDGLYGEIKDQFYTREQTNSLLDTKQPTLVSGTNIKTINGRSLLGSGDIVIEADGEDSIAYVAGPGINIDGTVISLTNANSSVIGGIKTGYTTNDRNYAVKLDSENRAYVTVPWAVPTTIEGKAGGHWQIIFKVSERQPTLPIDFDSNNEGWGSTAANTGTVWMADRFVEGDGTAGAWQGPWRISGPDGEAGVDGDQFEYIYKRTTSETAPTGQDSSTPSASGSGSTPADDDFVPANWNDNPTGVDVVYKYEWVSLRKKHNGIWSAFSGPVLWSAYGRLGTDGDGVEYIYYAKANVDFPETNPNTWTSDADFQDREYIRSGSGWTDDPVDLSTYPQGTKQFVSVRKKYASSNDSEPYWHAYSAPALWSYYATDGAVVGDAPVVYTIQVVQSTMAKAYGDTDTLTGKIAYRILRTQGLQREFISSSNSYGISTTVYLGSNTSKPLTSTYNSANGYWETSQLRSTVWSDDCEFSEIVVIETINSTNTIVAAAVVPTIIPGLNGEGSSVDIQSLNLVVTRMRGAWASGETYSDGKSRAENGVFYKDIVQYNNDYYVCLSQGTSNPPTTVVDGETVYSPDWGLLPLIGAAALETLLANSAYIKSLTANQVIVTREINGIEVPVTGLVNGSYIPKDIAGNNTTGNGVRIFAGTIPENGNLADTAFNVDEDGKMEAAGGKVVFNSDGSGNVAGGNIAWSANGNLSAITFDTAAFNPNLTTRGFRNAIYFTDLDFLNNTTTPIDSTDTNQHAFRWGCMFVKNGLILALGGGVIKNTVLSDLKDEHGVYYWGNIAKYIFDTEIANTDGTLGTSFLSFWLTSFFDPSENIFIGGLSAYIPVRSLYTISASGPISYADIAIPLSTATVLNDIILVYDTNNIVVNLFTKNLFDIHQLARINHTVLNYALSELKQLYSYLQPADIGTIDEQQLIRP